MDWFTILLLVTAVAVFLRWFKTADCDLTLSTYCHFGRYIGRGTGSLKGKVIWVTGASSGIGEGLAVEFAGVGAKLVLSARRKSELERVKEACLLANSALQDEDVLVLPLDLLNYDSHRSAAESVIGHFGGVDVLVNNAGRSQRALVEETEIGVDRAMLDVNVIGTLSLTKAILPSMLERPPAHIVCISSVAGKLPAVISASYSMSKHAIQGFFNTMRFELGDRGISVSLICPGPVVSEGSLNSMTSKVGQSVGAHAVDDKKKIPTRRCAYLVAVAIANKLEEVWIARNPILFFTYVFQYMPSVALWLGKAVSAKRVKAYKDGSRDINAGLTLNPFKMLRRR